jgi:hypothetical protein
VVISDIGLATHRMLPVNATALVGAGMVSVLVFPLVGFAIAGPDAGPVRTELPRPGRRSTRRGTSSDPPRRRAPSGRAGPLVRRRR